MAGTGLDAGTQVPTPVRHRHLAIVVQRLHDHGGHNTATSSSWSGSVRPGNRGPSRKRMPRHRRLALFRIAHADLSGGNRFPPRVAGGQPTAGKPPVTAACWTHVTPDGARGAAEDGDEAQRRAGASRTGRFGRPKAALHDMLGRAPAPAPGRSVPGCPATATSPSWSDVLGDVEARSGPGERDRKDRPRHRHLAPVVLRGRDRKNVATTPPPRPPSRSWT